MRQYIFIIVSLLLVAGCGKDKKAILRCKLDNANRQMTYLTYMTESGKHLIDSCSFRHSGKIKYNLSLKKTGFYELYFKNGKSINFIISPGEKITFKADYNQLYSSKIISGSPNSSRLNVLLDSLRQAQQNLNILRKEYTALQADKMAANKLDSIGKLYQQFIDQQKKFSIGFILNDIGSLPNIFALYQEYEPGYYIFNKYRDLQYFKIVSDSLAKYYPDLIYVKQLKNDFLSMNANFEMQKVMKEKDFSDFLPDLNLPGPNGKNISLSSLKGKFVLLTFWSSAHAESLDNMNALKGLYKKYHKKGFEIYQVAVDPSLSVWKKKIFFEEIEWPSVCDTLFPNSRTLMTYNVVGLPMNYLISRDQTEILAKNLSPEGLELRLSKLLN